jgi:predicted kinase
MSPGGSSRTLSIPRRSLVVLIGVSGSGKTTFARKHFGRFQVISSDYCRGLVSNDEADQSATPAAFDVLHYIAGKRLEFGKLTVVDATNVEVRARRSLLSLARDYNFKPIGIVLDIDVNVAVAQNTLRPTRLVAEEVIRSQYQELQASKTRLSKEGFHRLYVLKSPEEINTATLVVEA